MLEFAAWGVATSAVLYIQHKWRKMTDQDKIEEIFKNMGIGVQTESGKRRFPVLIDRHKNELGIEYVYKVPLGLPSKAIKKLNEGSEVFQDGLGKHVDISFDGMLRILVIEKDLPKKWMLETILPQCNGWKAPMGMGYKGMSWHNFEEIPHMTMGGTTRYGKTVLLKTIMTSLIHANPDDVEFYILDLKGGGLEFKRYEKLRQVKRVAGDVTSSFELLADLFENDIEPQMENFLANGWSNIVNTPIKKRKFVIVDEGAQLVPHKGMSPKEKKQAEVCQNMLSEIARVAGGVGYRLIFCTQYPTGDTLPRQIKQNADAKIAFRLPTRTASEVTLDESGAEDLPRIPGRGIYKTDERFRIQVPYISDNDILDLLSEYIETERKDVTPHESDIESIGEEKKETREDFIDL